MPKLRRLSGAEVITILERFGSSVHSHRGRHGKLRGVWPEGRIETLAIPAHDELDTDTCRAIYRQACRFVPDAELRPHFYTE